MRAYELSALSYGWKRTTDFSSCVTSRSPQLTPDLLLPPCRLCRKLSCVEPGEASVFDLQLSVYPYMAHVLAPGGIDEVRNGIEAGRELESGEVHRGHVRAFAGSE